MHASGIWLCTWVSHRGRKEGTVLFNDALNTFYLRLYGVRHMVKDHSDSERGNPLRPHRLLFSISSKGSFICIIPKTGSLRVSQIISVYIVGNILSPFRLNVPVYVLRYLLSTLLVLLYLTLIQVDTWNLIVIDFMVNYCLLFFFSFLFAEVSLNIHSYLVQASWHLKFLVPASAQRLVYQRPWYVLSCMWDGAYKRTLAANRKE